MAIHLSATAMLLLFSVLLISSVAADPAYRLLHQGPGVKRPSSAMVLPLYLSSPNTSRTIWKPHRRLQKSDHSTARMGLHDDLLRNGYYTTRLWIGTPPQKFALIVDTGSSVTYVPCSTCKQCGRHQDPKFQPESSKTYQPVKCNIDCNCDKNRVQCIYERQYAEMSTSAGILGNDVISFGNQSELEPQRAVFGCENVETGDLYTQHADGIMGLGRGDLSIVDQLVEKGVISDSFSLCYGGMGIGGGAMILGGISPPSDMVFSESDPVRSPYYNIDLREIHVAGKQLAVEPGVFDGRHGTVLDSGTTYTYLPEAAFVAFRDAIVKELHSLKRIHGPDPNYNDICFSGAGSDVSKLSESFPTVDMVFGTGQKLSLSPENYLFRHSKVSGAYCLGIFHGNDPTTLLGGIITRNTLVMYDREHTKIGFWKTNCSELWERLHFSDAPPPEPSASDRKNSTVQKSPDSDTKNSNVEKTPVPSPSIAPHPLLPAGTKVGEIVFALSLNISYSNLKPHINELRQHMALELTLTLSQIHMLNVTSEGNGSLVQFAIEPERPADKIPSATAVTIVSRLANNHLDLPSTYGSYKLIEWDIKPPVERTWWQRHSELVGVLVLVALLVMLSVSGVWVIWRQRQHGVNLYKPVDAAASEQELQPL